MLALKLQENIVERIVRTKSGQLVRAVFLVSEYQGELRVRLISASPIQKSTGIRNYELGIRNKILCISGACAKSPAITSEHHIYREIVSPFFNKLEFFVSQLTRAPSFK